MVERCTYIIYGFDYNNNVGGSLSLHSLAENLALLGEEVYITCKKIRKHSLVKILDPYEDIWSIYSKEQTIVIYPEIIFNNPLGAKNVCRWLMNDPDAFKNFSNYEPEGTFFKFSNLFNYKKLNKEIPLLFSFISKVQVFHPTTSKNNFREGTVYTLRKGEDISNKKELEEKLKKYPIKPDWKKLRFIDKQIFDIEIINIFGSCKYFISYDHATYLTIIAALCGCIPIVIPSEKYSKSEWIQNVPIQRYGVAYGFDEIEYAEKTLHLVKNNILEEQKNSLKSILNFNDFWYKKIFGEDYEIFNFSREDKLINAFVNLDLRDLVHFEKEDLKARSNSYLNLSIKIKNLIFSLVGYKNSSRIIYFLKKFLNNLRV